jgi:hypothetical protein
MQIELCRGISVQSGTVNAVIAPETVMISALNRNAGFRHFRFRYICGKYSRILNGINASSMNLEVHRAFTAHQLFTCLRETDPAVVFVEHDPFLFDGADAMLGPVADMLRALARTSLVILYTPVSDRTFSLFTFPPDSSYRIVLAQPDPQPIRTSRITAQYLLRPFTQCTLEAF